MNLFVIGSSNIDLVIYLKRIPKIGETVIGGEFKKIFGMSPTTYHKKYFKANSENFEKPIVY
jgi:sugar/nucleoside kinase (ribokinase family)